MAQRPGQLNRTFLPGLGDSAFVGFNVKGQPQIFLVAQHHIHRPARRAARPPTISVRLTVSFSRILEAKPQRDFARLFLFEQSSREFAGVANALHAHAEHHAQLLGIVGHVGHAAGEFGFVLRSTAPRAAWEP